MQDKTTLILGIGNKILTDDGIGARLAEDLIQIINNPKVQYNTASCGGLEIIEYIRDYKKVIFIDAIRTQKGKPGDVYYFRPSDFNETSHLSSIHDISFLTALNLGQMLNPGCQQDIHIIAIEIVEDMEFCEDMTPQLEEKYPQILLHVFEIIKSVISKRKHSDILSK